MKITISSILGLLLLAFTVAGCEEEDKKPINLLGGDETKSPYVRIVVEETVVAAGDIASSSFNAVVDDVDDNVASWELSVSRESGGIVSDTISLLTVNSFPSNISIPFTDIADAIGISTSEISGGDFIRFLGTSTGLDGSVFTFENFTGSITGQQEQRQAFNFIVLVKCSPISEGTVNGTWIVEMEDLYGDGWDGAFLTFEIDGVSTNYTVSAADATNATHIIQVPAGTNELVVSYTSGAFEEEHVYTVETPDGVVLGPFGPAPAPCIN